MHIGLLDNQAYLAELLRTWGLRSFRQCELSALDLAEMPVLVVPAGAAAEPVLDYARAGGTAVCFAPESALAEAAGLRPKGDKPLPAFLRMTAYMPPGLAGELLPIVGQAVEYERGDQAAVLGYFSYLDNPDGDSAGITSTPVGEGRIIAFAFDLPLCVRLLRQGDPALAEYIPPGDTAARQSHLACRLPEHGSGWVPHADLLALLLVDLLRKALPMPVPLLSHLPDQAPAILLYSGDEDSATPEENLEEMEWLTTHGARMDLNMFPDDSATPPEMLPCYLEHHDVGPHPNLRPLDGQSLEARLADFDRQLTRFTKKYGVRPTCLRNHSVTWVGYTEIVEVMERHGIRMDTNYTSGQYRRGRQFAPYAGFGAAMPVRFAHADGRLHEVFQLHTQIMDDVWFAPDAGVYKNSTYSYRFGPDAFDAITARIFDDLVNRLHTPLTVCIHPSNWVRFSHEQGQALVRHAQARNVPVWSVTQWCAFWDARDGWMIDNLSWSDDTLTFTLSGGTPHEALRVAVPVEYAGRWLAGVTIDGSLVEYATVQRYREAVALAPLQSGVYSICYR
ncbi:MAG: hypothetical protein ACYC6A_26265 [Armatimonadota bacterium]